jgi:hypothetical protein
LDVGVEAVDLPTVTNKATGSQPLIDALLKDARAMRAAGNLQGALGAYRELRSLVPAQSPLAAELSLAVSDLESRQRVAASLAEIDAAQEQDAELAALFDAGLHYYYTGEWAKARELLSEVVRKAPDYTRSGQQAAKLLDSAVDGHIRAQPAPGEAAQLDSSDFDPETVVVVTRRRTRPAAEFQASKLRWLWVALGLAALLVLGIVLLLLLGASGRASPAQLLERQPLDTSTIGQARHVFGPVRGELASVEDDRPEKAYAGVSVRNFIAYARFVNPPASSNSTRDFGFVFRETADDDYFQLHMGSNHRWMLRTRTPGGSALTGSASIGEGPLGTLINEGASVHNELLLVVRDGSGTFYINSMHGATVDVSDRIDAGDIAVAVDLFLGEGAGRKISYEEFTVWSLDP